jgi:hypothetical protein
MTTASQGVESTRPRWKHNAIVALVAVAGTLVVLIVAALGLSALASWTSFLISLVLLALCGWATTQLGRLPFRWALGVAGLLFVGATLASWSGEVQTVDHVRLALLNAIGVAAFAIGAQVGARSRGHRSSH